VSQNVPIASAAYFLVFILTSLMFRVLVSRLYTEGGPVRASLFAGNRMIPAESTDFDRFSGPENAFSGGHLRFCLLNARAQG